MCVASTQPGDGTEVHTRKQPEPNIVEVPSDHSQKSPKVPFKEQVVGVYFPSYSQQIQC